MIESYKQEVKQESRVRLIQHAINSLTINRKDSYLVSKEHLTGITEHFNSLLRQSKLWYEFDQDIKTKYNRFYLDDLSYWKNFYDTLCKSKSANELKVLYLSGPEPQNDIEVLCKNGILLENIWAIESDKPTYQYAINSLIELELNIKIHRGSLSEFFEFTNHEFDIIYYDACSPIFSPSQSPLETFKQIFLNKRLAPLSALITNFSEPGDNYNWDKMLASWFSTRYTECIPEIEVEFGDIPEKSLFYLEYVEFIKSNLELYYDKFLTSFIPALGSEIIPMFQFASMSSIQTNHLLVQQSLTSELNNIKNYRPIIKNPDDLFLNVPHFLISLESYPLLNWARISKEQLPKECDINKFLDKSRNKISFENALYIGSLLKRFEEADTNLKTFIYNICDPKLKETLKKLDFFDRDLHLSLDIPMKNLFIELLIGLYGNPYIAHAGRNLSLKYKAKERWMYSDVFIFDQCRYLYDFIPTFDLWDKYFESCSKQVIVRGCIDGIRRNHLHLNTDLFKWGFIEGVYGNDFGRATLEDRINLMDL